MASNLTESSTNQHVFDSFVRSVLDSYEVPVIDQSIEGLLESIGHGEASVNSALNLIVVAHVAHLFLEVCVPYEEPEWADKLRGLIPRIREALSLCEDLLAEDLTDQEQGAIGTYGNHWRGNHWRVVVSFEYGKAAWNELITTWEESVGSPFLVPTSTRPLVHSFVQDLLLSIVKRTHPAEPIDVARFVHVIPSPGAFGQTSWHRFVVRDVIRAFMGKPEQLGWEEWCSMVDLCAELLRTAELVGTDMADLGDEHGIFRSDICFPPTSAEHWAWEFGRVAAMWPLVDKTVFKDDFGTEHFDGWDNGLSALSLISIAQEPGDVLVDRCWLGALATWRSAPEPDPSLIQIGEPTYPAYQLASDHLSWVMRLGYLDGVKRIEQRELPKPPADLSDPDVLLLGSAEEIGRAVSHFQEKAAQEDKDRIKNELAESLVKVWDKLPEDSQDHLIDAEVHLRNRRPHDASLDYAIAVEIALSEWLKPARHTRDWPDDDIGAWASCLRKMTGPKQGRHRLDTVLRQRFDPRVAYELAEALDVFRRARLPRAHGKPRPPYAKKVRETALGKGQRKGVFQLILRFAKQWQ